MKSNLYAYTPYDKFTREEREKGADTDCKVIAELLRLSITDENNADLSSFIEKVNKLTDKKFNILEGEIHDFSPQITNQPFTTKPLRLQVIWSTHNFDTECQTILDILNCLCKYGAFKIEKEIEEDTLDNDKK